MLSLRKTASTPNGKYRTLYSVARHNSFLSNMAQFHNHREEDIEGASEVAITASQTGEEKRTISPNTGKTYRTARLGCW